MTRRLTRKKGTQLERRVLPEEEIKIKKTRYGGKSPFTEYYKKTGVGNIREAFRMLRTPAQERVAAYKKEAELQYEASGKLVPKEIYVAERVTDFLKLEKEHGLK